MWNSGKGAANSRTRAHQHRRTQQNGSALTRRRTHRQVGALRGEHRASATLSRLVETASMHSVHPVAPPPSSSEELLQPPPALQLDSVGPPAAAAAMPAADVAMPEVDPTPRSSARGRSSRRASKAASTAAVRTTSNRAYVGRDRQRAPERHRMLFLFKPNLLPAGLLYENAIVRRGWGQCYCILGQQEDADVPVRASTWTSLMDAVATTPAARRLSTSTSGKADLATTWVQWQGYNMAEGQMECSISGVQQNAAALHSDCSCLCIEFQRFSAKLQGQRARC